MKKYEPEILAQVKVCGEYNTYCAHPVEAGEIFNFGNGEIALMHLHTDDVDYSAGGTSLSHGQTGIHARAKVVLTRSFDGGCTWPKSEHVTLFDQGLSVEEQQAILAVRATESNTPPVTENTIYHFGKSFCGRQMADGRHEIVPFVMRSEDKGHTWSDKFAIPDNVGFSLLQAHGNIVRQGDRFLKPFVVSTTPDADNCGRVNAHTVLYSSENNGVTWQIVSTMTRDPYGEDCHSYPTLLDLGGGHLMVTVGCWRMMAGAHVRWISTAHTYDNGLNWTPVRRIQSFGISPYALQLRDGRILVVYCKRDPASVRGIYGILSDDQGQTWSEEFTLHLGASGRDIGYPVAIENDDGSIFTAYYYMEKDGQGDGDARFIGGTVFTI